MSTTGGRRRGRGDDGIATLFTVTILAALVVMLGLVVDGGRIFSAHRQNRNVALAAARAGAQEVDPASLAGAPSLDVARARSRAAGYLSAAGAEGRAEVLCHAGVCDRVRVTVSRAVRMTFLGVFGVNDTTVASTETARLASGISQEGG